MASLVSSVCRASGGVFLSPCDSRTKCSVGQPKAELVPSVSHSDVRRQQIGVGRDCCFAIAPAFGRRGLRLSSVRRRAGGAPGDDDEPTKPGTTLELAMQSSLLHCIVMNFKVSAIFFSLVSCWGCRCWKQRFEIQRHCG